MRILHIITSLSSGGAEKMLADIAPLMGKRKNVQVDVLVLSDENNVFEKDILNNGVNLFKANSSNLYNPYNILIIRRKIKNGNYDIVHSHLFPTNYWTALAFKTICRRKPKLITTEHNTYNRRRDSNYFKVIEKNIYSTYDKIVSISEKTEHNLKKWLELDMEQSEKYKIISNGIDFNRYYKATSYKKCELNNTFNEETKLLCMVGSFTKQKDQKSLIKIMQELDENIHLLLIGEGELLNEHVKLTEKLNVQDRVHFMGFRNDVDRILKTVDIVVLSSHWEGFGLAAAEGMAANKPLIASNVDGLREVVENAGLLFKNSESDEIKKSINRLINNEEYYEKVRRSCVQKAKKLDINNTVEKYLEIYSR